MSNSCKPNNKIINLYIPEIFQGQKLSYLLEKLFIERRKNFKILNQDFYSFGTIISNKYCNFRILFRKTM